MIRDLETLRYIRNSCSQICGEGPKTVWHQPYLRLLRWILSSLEEAGHQTSLIRNLWSGILQLAYNKCSYVKRGVSVCSRSSWYFNLPRGNFRHLSADMWCRCLTLKRIIIRREAFDPLTWAQHDMSQRVLRLTCRTCVLIQRHHHLVLFLHLLHLLLLNARHSFFMLADNLLTCTISIQKDTYTII